MNRSAKYLASLVTLTFVVGQVQFAFSSYFCTMKQTTVSASQTPGADDAMSCADQCEAGDAVVKDHHVTILSDASCIQFRLSEKKVVDTFAGSEKPQKHFVTVVTFVPPMTASIPGVRQQFVSPECGSSSPPDIPTLNSNLRI